MRAYQKIVIFFAFYAPIGICFSQNIVPNPGFELNSGCPNAINDITKFANNWVVYDPTPDYFNTCAGISSLDIPGNFAGWQYASGNAYCGAYVYIEPGVSPANNREAIGSQLTTPMVIGQKYYVSLKVSLANNSRFSINNIGLLFTTTPYCSMYSPPPTVCPGSSPEIGTPNFAHIYSSSVISDTLNWTVIQGTFVSDSIYSYVTWGNFFSDSLTTAVDRGGPAVQTYFYVDDICVSTDSATCWILSSIQDEKNSKLNVKIFPNPFQNETIVEFDNPLKNIYTLKLYNSLGEIVFSLTDIKTDHVVLNRKELGNGVYFFSLEENGQIKANGKLIVN